MTSWGVNSGLRVAEVWPVDAWVMTSSKSERLGAREQFFSVKCGFPAGAEGVPRSLPEEDGKVSFRAIV